ncbi:hypothetical protein [Ruminiclostridium papyrosolvens]|uniref:Butirosin biosynthesis protein H N-terminal domain-containing protein n=1 Tax=Ruminiclostridium papyrosolvens C7 TaxID=1330534 RepID=U4R5U9_9FIRM|nr:hypothetical protein [Ruminiclostridium papyrosolvens]EPR14071.1 hypothetical protein L323_01665 [Ruminiclostridium papyrosolvens C7]
MSYQLSENKLRINIQKDLTTYLNYSLPLCAILTDDSLYSWFYQHFVQLYTLTDDNGNLWVDYLEHRDFYRDVAENKIYDYKRLSEEKDIVEFIINKINQGCYVIIFVDEYYLPKKLSYMSNHFLHQLMVYGYSNQTETLMTIAFNEKGVFTSNEYTYKILNQAYELGKENYQSSPVWVLNETAEIIKPKNNIETYNFKLDLFLEELKIYLSGDGNYSMIRPNNLETNGRQASFNFKVHDELILHLNDLIQGKNTMDFRYMHLMFEHKSIMHKRLEYIVSHFNSSEILVMLIREYSGVVKKALYARNLFLKHSVIAQGGSDNESYKTELLLKIIDTICLVKEQEEKILTNIYDELKNINI